jgi:hypothetical protein
MDVEGAVVEVKEDTCYRVGALSWFRRCGA